MQRTVSLPKRIAIAAFFIFLPVRAQELSPDSLLRLYDQDVYYLTNHFGGWHLKSQNCEFLFAAPGILGMVSARESFLGDFPKVSEELSAFRRLGRYGAVATYGATLLSLLADDSVGNGWSGATSSLLFAAGWSMRDLAHLHLQRAVSESNLARLKSGAPPDAFTRYSARALRREDVPFLRPQLVGERRVYDIPAFLRPEPETDALFRPSDRAAASYDQWKQARRRGAWAIVGGVGLIYVSLLTVFSAEETPATQGIVVSGVLASIGSFIYSAVLFQRAENLLEQAVYLLNRHTLQESLARTTVPAAD